MQHKFICVLAIFAIVAAITFSEVDACRRCNIDSCGGCSGGFISVPVPAPAPISIPIPGSIHAPIPYNSCHGCGGNYGGVSFLPKRYCSGCQRRKLYRLSGGGGCGCGGSCGGGCDCDY